MYAAGTSCGFLVDRTLRHSHKALDVASELEWREGCDQVSGTANHWKKWAKKEQCCLASWDEIVSRGERSGHRRHANATST